MLIVSEVKDFHSPDPEYKREPDEPDNCSILVEVSIGVKGRESVDIFSFVAATPKAFL